MHNQIECCHAQGRKVVGIIDPDYSGTLHGLPVLDETQYLAESSSYEFFIATNSSPIDHVWFKRDRAKRQGFIDYMDQHGLVGATLIHPTAVVSPGARIGQNVSIGALSFVMHDAVIHNHIVIREQAFVGHHVEILDNAVIQIGVKITSHTQIGSGAYIGVNSSIVNRYPVDHETLTINKILIGENTVVYPNETVLRTIPKNTTVFARRSRG